MSISWRNLRSLSGSQQKAFEALCCQLAEHEEVPKGSTFIRKADPDAGIECYWRLSNGEEWGWQAKFFLSTPNKSQWQQIDKSVKKALDKHPRLTSYTICFPIDRADPHIEKEKWFMDKWNESEKKWKEWAQIKGISLKYKYWGEHEIFERLSLDEHRGRYEFWFNKELFSRQWFDNQISEATANVGPRYQPELNIELPIVRLFDGLGRTSDFFDKIKNLHRKLKKSYFKSQTARAKELNKDEFVSLEKKISLLLEVIESIEKSEIDYINFDSIAENASKSSGVAINIISKLMDIANEERKKAKSSRKQKKRVQDQKIPNHTYDFGYERYHLNSLMAILGEIEVFTRTGEAKLANIPALLLIGNAGTGKTHLLCDLAKKRVCSNLPTLLLLGGQFNTEEPWSQIIKRLGLSCKRDEFLGALDAAAQARNSKAIILIDALNEGEGKKLWEKHFSGMLTTLSRYPWIGIAVSVRTSYEGIIIPKGLVPNKLIREIHGGFVGHEYKATKVFFEHYGIELPSVPLIIPEFQNPLFLILFCDGLKNRGLTKMPTGLRGISAIFDFFIESVNEKLSKPDFLDYDLKTRIPQNAINKLADMMATKEVTWLHREEAQEAVDSILPRDGYENSLFRHMISEGLLTEDQFLKDEEGDWCEGIHFSYERFADHLIAKYLLEKYLDLEKPSHTFLPHQKLGKFLKNEQVCWRYRGLIEAFSIQLPEIIKKELYEVAPNCSGYRPVKEAFIESIIWRDPKAIQESTLNYINSHIIKYEDTYGQFLIALLTIATNPDHPYNADFLHSNLIKKELPIRDAIWSIFLHYNYGEQGAVDRLIEWAWSGEDKSHIGDESIRLCGTALSWFLTSSNRSLRDCATKALVSILTLRIKVLTSIIKEFLSVDDPYILERLFAVAYGCAMRSDDLTAIGELANDIFRWIFKDGTPPQNILLRDYARGVVELALYLGINLNINIEKVRPPYKSEWPSKIPSKEELKKYGETRRDMSDEEWSLYTLYNSVMGFGDFARYVIGTNSGRFNWSSRRLDKPKELSKKEIYERFEGSLTEKQKKAWDRYLAAREKSIRIIIPSFVDDGKGKKIIKFSDLPHEDIKKLIKKEENSFYGTLGKKKQIIFKAHVIPYLKNPRAYIDEYRFDLSIAQCWIFKRILELGWTLKRFGRFDRALKKYSYYGRESYKPERIGKKYQWIAFYEFLALVSDNFEFKGEEWSDRPDPDKYEGPWQIGYIRNIDPSSLLRRTERQKWYDYHTNTWWFPSQYDVWDSEPNDVKWLKNAKDIPSIEPLFIVKNPQDGSKWIVLDAYYHWENPSPSDEERYEIPKRTISYEIKSYITKKSDMDELFKWAKDQNFWGGWMPKSHGIYDVFLGEFFWAPAFEYYNIPYFHHNGWTQGNRKKIPKKVLVTSDNYIKEHPGYDCSIKDSISIYLPAKWISDQLGLKWNGVDGHFYDVEGKLMVFDPSVMTSGPGALLINFDAFTEFLGKNGYDFFWTILGEKNFIGGGLSNIEWKGRLGISGAYKIQKSKIIGKYTGRFIFSGGHVRIVTNSETT